MEEQDILNLETGTKEIESLKSSMVNIVKISVETVKKKGEDTIIGNKAVFEVKHPAREELIKISSIKYKKKDQFVVSGSWINLDEDNKLRKGSVLANFIGFNNKTFLNELLTEYIETVEDGMGFLCFKSY